MASLFSSLLSPALKSKLGIGQNSSQSSRSSSTNNTTESVDNNIGNNVSQAQGNNSSIRLPTSIHADVRSPGFTSRLSSLVKDGDDSVASSPCYRHSHLGLGPVNIRRRQKIRLTPRNSNKLRSGNSPVTIRIAPPEPFSPFKSRYVSTSSGGRGSRGSVEEGSGGASPSTDPRSVIAVLAELSGKRSRRPSDDPSEVSDEESKRARRDSSSSLGSSLSMEMPPLFQNGVVGQTTSHLVSRETDLSLGSLLSRNQTLFGGSGPHSLSGALGTHGPTVAHASAQTSQGPIKSRSVNTEILASLSSSRCMLRKRGREDENEDNLTDDEMETPQPKKAKANIYRSPDADISFPKKSSSRESSRKSSEADTTLVEGEDSESKSSKSSTPNREGLVLPSPLELLGTPTKTKSPERLNKTVSSKEDLDADRKLQRKRLNKMLAVFSPEDHIAEEEKEETVAEIVKNPVPTVSSSSVVEVEKSAESVEKGLVESEDKAKGDTSDDNSSKNEADKGDKPGGFPFVFGEAKRPAPPNTPTSDGQSVGGFSFEFGKTAHNPENPAVALDKPAAAAEQSGKPSTESASSSSTTTTSSVFSFGSIPSSSVSSPAVLSSVKSPITLPLVSAPPPPYPTTEQTKVPTFGAATTATPVLPSFNFGPNTSTAVIRPTADSVEQSVTVAKVQPSTASVVQPSLTVVQPSTTKAVATVAQQSTAAPATFFTPSKPEAKKSEAETKIAPTFSFGSNTALPTFNFNATPTTKETKPESVKTFQFGQQPKATAQVTASTAAESSFSFSSSTTPGFTFGKTAAAPVATTAAPSFGSLGAAVTTAAVTAPGLVAPTFGGSSVAGGSGGAAVFQFGQKPTTTTTASQPAFQFGQAATTTATAAPFTFGKSAAPATTATAPSFSFGQVAVAPTTTASPFQFGQTTTTAAAAAPSFSFGQKAAVATTTAAPFQFGQTAAAVTTATASPFQFGQTTTTTSALPNPVQPSFSFGGTTNNNPFGTFQPPATTTSGSTFSIPITKASSTSGVFGKLEPAGAAAPPTNLFTFGGGNNQPPQPQPATTQPSFSFGDKKPAATAAASPFSFGGVTSPAAAPAPAAAPGVFQFGQNAPPQPAATGFNFAAAAQSPPAFNFGAGAAPASNNVVSPFGAPAPTFGAAAAAPGFPPAQAPGFPGAAAPPGGGNMFTIGSQGSTTPRAGTNRRYATARRNRK